MINPQIQIRTSIQFVGFYLFFFIAAIAFTGCETYPPYAGSELPKDKVAILKMGAFAHDGGVVIAVYVDGNKMPYFGTSPTLFSLLGLAKPRSVCHPESIKLLPGHHTIMFLPAFGYIHADYVSKDIDVEAGKTYRAKMLTRNTQVISRQGREVDTEGEWGVDIIDDKFSDRFDRRILHNEN